MEHGNIFIPADILLPKSAEVGKWATIACDQFSSEPEYWERVKNYVGDSPSTLNMMLPEAWLEGADMDETARNIGVHMEKYLREGVFDLVPESYIYTERRLSGGKLRRGIVGALDLDAYSYDPQSDAPVKASENTVIDRLPPRIKMREIAKLEMPHVMVLIDDPDRTVIEPLSDKTSEMEELYSFDLMERGGHIMGSRVTGAMAREVQAGLARLASQEEAERKYGKGTSPILMIIGDGNHSLAAAKVCWEKIKPTLTQAQREKCPARFALVELGNIHDESLEIEPIHRAVFGVGSGLVEGLKARVKDFCPKGDGGYVIKYFMGRETGEITVGGLTIGDTIGLLQEYIDWYTAENAGSVDYIHGEDALRAICEKDKVVGFSMPAIKKEDLFKSVILSGVFPKKSFSMGRARDKRYYLETREI